MRFHFAGACYGYRDAIGYALMQPPRKRAVTLESAGEREVTALFAIPCVAIFIYAICQYQIADSALKELVPVQLTEGLTEKFVLGGLALSPLTPLQIQTTYMKALWAFTVAMLCFSLSLFSAGEVFGGWLVLGGSLIHAVFALRSWMTYQENCRRRTSPDNAEKS
jgi:hypothetical protein